MRNSAGDLMTSETTRQTEPESQQHGAAAAVVTRNAATAEAAWRRYIAPLTLAALIVIMITQLWTSVVQLSITSDEIDHLHAAYRYWQCNDFGWNPEHPPLVKIIAALPLLAMHINDPFHRGSSHQNSTRRMSKTNSSKNTSIVAARIVS